MNAARLTALARTPASARAPLAWVRADEQPIAFRACYLCTHGADCGTTRVCQHPALLDACGKAQPVAALRAWGGGCGPDALKHTDLPREA